MCELGYKNFCAACKGSVEEKRGLMCRDKDGRLYGLPVECVLSAPCFKSKTKNAFVPEDICSKEWGESMMKQMEKALAAGEKALQEENEK